MQHHIDTIVKYFFRKDSLFDVPERDIKQFISDYPYSTIGQLLLAEKWRQTSSEQYHEQAVRTSLYFHNPTWLHWQLEDHQAPGETLAAAIAAEGLPLEAAGPVTEQVVTTLPTAENEEAVIPGPVIETAGAPGHGTIGEAAIETEAEPVAGPSQPAETTGTPAEPTIIQEEPDIAFEPYHTIDYFASQGIKLKQEDLKDKLGQQLKSFTEWLRSMKRITPSAGNTGMEETDQQNIQLIAEHSVEGKDIVTEAMAEVWVKQGNYRKAIAIYEKLSLLNPLKSPYFADRIQHLKAL